MNEMIKIVEIRVNVPKSFLLSEIGRWFPEAFGFLTFISSLLAPASSVLALRMV